MASRHSCSNCARATARFVPGPFSSRATTPRIPAVWVGKIQQYSQRSSLSTIYRSVPCISAGTASFSTSSKQPDISSPSLPARTAIEGTLRRPAVATQPSASCQRSSSRPFSSSSPSPAASSSPPKTSTLSATRDTSLAKRVAQTVRHTAPTFTETYVAYGATEQLVRECVRPVAYVVYRGDGKDAKREKELLQNSNSGTDAETILDSTAPKQLAFRNARGEEVGVGMGWWYAPSGLALEPTFNNWAQISLLHMWLVTVRLRAFPAATAGAWHQHLINHFFFLAEDRLATVHNMSMKGFRQRTLKDLFAQWRGLTVAYDEGMARPNDAILAAAVWRNVCRANPAVDLRRLAQVVAFMRDVLRFFDTLEDEDFAKADILFGDPAEESELVKLKSREMKVGEKEKGGSKSKR